MFLTAIKDVAIIFLFLFPHTNELNSDARLSKVAVKLIDKAVNKGVDWLDDSSM